MKWVPINITDDNLIQPAFLIENPELVEKCILDIDTSKLYAHTANLLGAPIVGYNGKLKIMLTDHGASLLDLEKGWNDIKSQHLTSKMPLIGLIASFKFLLPELPEMEQSQSELKLL